MAIANMKHSCPICKRGFPGRKALRSHLGTKNQISAVSHHCSLCEQRFCSEGALLQHQGSQSHNIMFKCDKCKGLFRSKQALTKHQRAVQHGATLSAVAPSLRARSEVRRSSGAGLMAGWNVNSITGQMMNMQLGEDWALCDKDCGWCGHCAESYGY